MSYMSPTPRDDSEARRRATWGLTILALVAVLIVAIMVFFVGTSGGKKNTVGDVAEPSLTTETSGSPQPSGSATHPSSTAHSSPSRSKTPTTSASATHPKATSTANPCPSPTPCAVDGDAGQAVEAVNAFRVQHGLPPVAGSVSANAQQCALHEGSGPTCVPHYSWEPVATRDGAKAVGAVAGNGGSKWLLDPGMKSFSVGWAYAPGGGGHYEFVILKVT